MRRWSILAAMCALCWTAPLAAAPLAAYGALPSLANPALSPNGKLLAYLTNVGSEQAVMIISIDDRKLVAGLKTGGQKLRDLSWADDDHLLTTFSTTGQATGLMMRGKQEWLLGQSYSIRTGKEFPLLAQSPGRSLNVLSRVPQSRTANGHMLVYASGITLVNGRGVAALFAIDVDYGETKMVALGHAQTTGFVIDETGQVVAETAYDDGNQTWKLFLRDGEARHEIYSEAAPIESPAVEGIGPDGTSLILTMPDGKDKQLKLSDGSEEPPPDFGGRYEGVIHDPLTHRIIGVVRLAAATSYHFLNRADQAAWDAVAGAYAGENVQIASWSADRKRLLVRVDGKRDGAAYQLVDLNAHTSITIAQVYKGISPFDVAEVRNVTYKAADGMEIQAYLTLPDGRDPKNLPLVVLPHGGPAARDEPGFDWWSQALASRGYAVLQPQFRGSDGFGHDFLAAGFGQWGRKMQSDVSDGVRYLAKQGTIDPKRVCIVGASYGGYAALAGITLEHGVYRCAVAVAGVSDPHRMLVWERTRAGNDDDSLVLRYWNRFMGSENLDDPRLNEISPLSHAAQADAPLLLIHGRDDTVVTIQQSRDMEDALESARKPVTFVQLDGEDHWLSRPETRLKMLEETVKFLEANNPPG